MAFEPLAIITNEAKRRTAEMWVSGKSFQVKYFAVSAGGHDPTDPTVALAPDPAATQMPGTPFFGPEPVDSYEFTSDFCPRFICRIEENEVSGGVSSVGLYGEIVYSPIPLDPEIGTTFLFAVYNRPLLILAGDAVEFVIDVFL
jgi:hypothetical protein